MDKDFLKNVLLEGKTNREIGKIVGLSPKTVNYWINKYNLKDWQRCKKPVYKNQNMFNKIDTPQKAYIVGFILADGYVSDDCVEIGVALRDYEILYFISNQVGGNINKYDYIDKSKRRFPRGRMSIGNKQIVTDINKFGGKKNDRHIPIVRKDLKRYLVLGFFDGDGCITWGRRKDRNRIWQKVSFTSSYKMLCGIQNILLEYVKISTSIKPKSDGNCYVLSFSSKTDVLKFFDFIYPDNSFVVLQRKYNKANALRLELGEFREDPRTLSEVV